jgi:hypothetical protein
MTLKELQDIEEGLRQKFNDKMAVYGAIATNQPSVLPMPKLAKMLGKKAPGAMEWRESIERFKLWEKRLAEVGQEGDRIWRDLAVAGAKVAAKLMEPDDSLH